MSSSIQSVHAIENDIVDAIIPYIVGIDIDNRSAVSVPYNDCLSMLFLSQRKANKVTHTVRYQTQSCSNRRFHPRRMPAATHGSQAPPHHLGYYGYYY